MISRVWLASLNKGWGLLQLYLSFETCNLLASLQNIFVIDERYFSDPHPKVLGFMFSWVYIYLYHKINSCIVVIWIILPIEWCNGLNDVTRRHVTLVIISGTTIMVRYFWVKSLRQLIWRSGTRRFHLRVPDLQMSCRLRMMDPAEAARRHVPLKVNVYRII